MLSQPALAHPVPNTGVLLDIRALRVDAKLQLPLQELQPAFDHGDIALHPAELVPQHEADLRQYLLQHIHPVGPNGQPWQVRVGSMHKSWVQLLIGGFPSRRFAVRVDDDLAVT